MVDAAAAVALRGRAAERLATRAETAAQAPWRAAIAAAQALKQAMDEARGYARDASNDPMGGTAGHQTSAVSNDPMGGIGSQARDASNDPMGGMAGHQTSAVSNDPMGGIGSQARDVSNDPMGGMAGHQTSGASNDPMGGIGSQARDVSNDPIGGTTAGVRAAGVPLDMRVGVLAERRAGETTEWAPGSPGLWEALARELEKRRLRAEMGLRGNDPMGGNTEDAHSRGAVLSNPAPLHRRSSAFIGGENCLPSSRTSTRGLALGSTRLARTWEPSVAEVLAARFGPPTVVGWLGVAAVPLGIAAMPSGGCAQRPYMRLSAPEPGAGGKLAGLVPRR